jgi:hypothetical protein
LETKAGDGTWACASGCVWKSVDSRT